VKLKNWQKSWESSMISTTTKTIELEIYGEPYKHFEAELYKRNKNLATFYIKSNFHQYRLSLIVDQIKRIVEKAKKKVVMVNLGCGTGELESKLVGVENLYKIGVDVSEEAITEGIKAGLFDRAIVADMTEPIFEKIDFPKPIDIVVAAEVLEHVQHPGVFIKNKISVLQNKGGFFLGSVPNMAQLNDVIGLFTGKGYSYQTTRPLLDSTSGHISFFSLESLKNTLSFGGYNKVKIAGNGVRLFRKGDFGYRFLSKIPFLKQFSDRFVFSCQLT